MWSWDLSGIQRFRSSQVGSTRIQRRPPGRVGRSLGQDRARAGRRSSREHGAKKADGVKGSGEGSRYVCAILTIASTRKQRFGRREQGGSTGIYLLLSALPCSIVTGRPNVVCSYFRGYFTLVYSLVPSCVFVFFFRFCNVPFILFPFSPAVMIWNLSCSFHALFSPLEHGTGCGDQSVSQSISIK